MGATRAMEDAKAADAPIRFYAIGHGSYDGYFETFVFATSTDDAVDRFCRDMRGDRTVLWKDKVSVWEAEINKHGVLESTNLIKEVEVEC